jgi:hypothetical protein
MFFTYIVRYTRLFSLYPQASDVGETQDLVPATVCYLFLNSELVSYVIPCSMGLIGKLINSHSASQEIARFILARNVSGRRLTFRYPLMLFPV